MSQKNIDFVRSHMDAEAVKLAGFSEKGQHLRKIRFREALQVIIDKDLMVTMARVEKAFERAGIRLVADGMTNEVPGEVFKRAFLSELERR